MSYARRSGVLLCSVSIAMISACQLPPGGLEPVPASQSAPLLRFPGVDVGRTANDGVSIRIIGAVLGEMEPLFIVDGTPVTVKRGGKLDWLSPNDITSIHVLKYPTETAVYGPRGVNGVVLIRTKWALGSEPRR